jgi:peptidoglycan/xylan/chitin deacetylase (PgdA/CDA1 family)
MAGMFRVPGTTNVSGGLPPQSLKIVGSWVVGRIGCGLSQLIGSRARDAFAILTYHRVTTNPSGWPAPTWNVPPALFRQQLAGLLGRGYRARPLRQVLEFGRLGQPIPPGTFVVTFDDGFENLYSEARPILRALNVPATVFLATAYLDRIEPFPFDDWLGAGSSEVPRHSWRPLSSAQCSEMLEEGLIDLGSHTHTHAVFRGRPDAFEQDLAASLAILRDRFGLADIPFSYPFGIVEPALAATARRVGLLCALSTQANLVRPRSDPLTWGRFTVAPSDTSSTLMAKLDGWFSLARSAWLRMRRTPVDHGPVGASPVGTPAEIS